MHVSWPYHPQLRARIRIGDRHGSPRVERVDRRPTYVYQLEAFRDAIRDGVPVATDAVAGVNQMRTLDAIYQAAGMSARPSTPSRPTGTGIVATLYMIDLDAAEVRRAQRRPPLLGQR